MVFAVTPATLLACASPDDRRAIRSIVRLAKENPLWGGRAGG
jgi:hypothetical protein